VKSLARPIVVISRCLGFEACRYDGTQVECDLARRLKSHARLIPVCPELEAGLGVPREKIQVIEKSGHKEVRHEKTGKQATEAIEEFADRFLSSLNAVDGFILKSRSPSCGVRDVKVFAEAGTPTPSHSGGSGLFADAIKKRFPSLAIEDECRLDDSSIRERWLTRLFVQAAFRESRKLATLAALRAFHEHNVLLFRSISKQGTAQLSELFEATNEHLSEVELERYQFALSALLERPQRRDNAAQILLEAFNHFSEHLLPEESELFRSLMRRFNAGSISLPEVLKWVRIWGVRYDRAYLRHQSFFRPYPESLMSTT
jgi:uncharacterized protein YbbK (DUF523 family)/uncharacterized protein YbgA (DUF1722 family)